MRLIGTFKAIRATYLSYNLSLNRRSLKNMHKSSKVSSKNSLYTREWKKKNLENNFGKVEFAWSELEVIS